MIVFSFLSLDSAVIPTPRGSLTLAAVFEFADLTPFNIQPTKVEGISSCNMVLPLLSRKAQLIEIPATNPPPGFTQKPALTPGFVNSRSETSKIYVKSSSVGYRTPLKNNNSSMKTASI